MSFASELNKLNQFHFFREFTFSQTRFSPPGNMELELANSIICVGDALVIFQLKGRSSDCGSKSPFDAKWFETKVLGKARA